MEIWGQHGDWASIKSQKYYMKRDVTCFLYVSLAANEPKLPSYSLMYTHYLALLRFDIRDDTSTSNLF